MEPSFSQGADESRRTGLQFLQKIFDIAPDLLADSQVILEWAELFCDIVVRTFGVYGVSR